MLIRKAPDLTYADVTPRSVYLDRRKFLRAMGLVGAGGGWLTRKLTFLASEFPE